LADPASPYDRLIGPGGDFAGRGDGPAEAAAWLAAAPWPHFQMPAYHLARPDGQGGVTIVNIGVGPSNAKNITDHLAVLRPPVARHRRRHGERHAGRPGLFGVSAKTWKMGWVVSLLCISDKPLHGEIKLPGHRHCRARPAARRPRRAAFTQAAQLRRAAFPLEMRYKARPELWDVAMPMPSMHGPI
jgi:hypothetical protein